MEAATGIMEWKSEQVEMVMLKAGPYLITEAATGNYQG